MVIKRTKYYAFTRLVIHGTDCSKLRNYVYNIANKIAPVEYMILGYEQATNDHYQGFVIFKDPVSFYKAKRALDNCYVAEMISTIEQNILYCKKGCNFTEYGKLLSEGVDKCLNLDYPFPRDPEDPYYRPITPWGEGGLTNAVRSYFPV